MILIQKPGRFSGGGCSRNFPWSSEAVVVRFSVQWGGGYSSRHFASLTSTRFRRGRGCSTHFRIITTHSLMSRDIHESISQFGKTRPKTYTTKKITKQKIQNFKGSRGARAPQAPWNRPVQMPELSAPQPWLCVSPLLSTRPQSGADHRMLQRSTQF